MLKIFSKHFGARNCDQQSAGIPATRLNITQSIVNLTFGGDNEHIITSNHGHKTPMKQPWDTISSTHFYSAVLRDLPARVSDTDKIGFAAPRIAERR